MHRRVIFCSFLLYSCLENSSDQNLVLTEAGKFQNYKTPLLCDFYRAWIKILQTSPWKFTYDYLSKNILNMNEHLNKFVPLFENFLVSPPLISHNNFLWVLMKEREERTKYRTRRKGEKEF